MAIADFAGFGINGYRSFGGDTISWVGPMKKMHLVVGQNNVGKSNALHFMADVLSSLSASGNAQIERKKLYAGTSDRPMQWGPERSEGISLGFYLTEAVREALKFSNSAVERWLSCDAYTHGDEGVIWLDFTISPVQQLGSKVVVQLSEEQAMRAQKEGGGFSIQSLSSISMQLSHGSGGTRSNLDSILRSWRIFDLIPDVEWIDAVRELTATGEENLRTGQGIVPRLATLQSPSIQDYAGYRAQFDALQDFVRDVLEDENARIEIPDAKNTIHVHSRTGLRELGQLGTGINELIFLATIASINHDRLICIEEPEIHLHPTLQRKLIDYLDRRTANNYLISTHSAAMLNAETATITHVEMPEKWSVTSPVFDTTSLARVTSDLGNRASDIVQSNFIVWVEGPSDRIYLRHWLTLADPLLVEGAHYSIMFYGGALLSHLSVDDQELDDFIHLLRINRNLAVVIDSDRKTADHPLNETKRRVLEELDDIDAPALVTAGYTIENYVPRSEMQKSINELYPTKKYSVPSGKYRSPLGHKFEGSSTFPSKTTVARYIVDLPIQWKEWPEDLTTKIDSITRAIRRANGLGSPE